MLKKWRWNLRVWQPAAALALLTILVAPLWSSIDVSAQDELPSVAAAAPESTVLFHSLDLDWEGGQWQQTEELLARVGLPDALELWEEAILEEGTASGDFTSADLDALLGGEMAFVVTPQAVERLAANVTSLQHSDALQDMGEATPVPRSGDQRRGFAAILVPGDPDLAWNYVERQFTDLSLELDVALEESSYGEVELLAIARRDPSPGVRDDSDPLAEWLAEFDLHGSGRLVAGRVDEYIIVGPHEADVTGVVDVIDGTAASLADSSKAQEIAAELPADALAFAYVDGQGIIDALGPELTALFQSYTLEVPKEAWAGQLGFTISADEPGFRFDTITVLGEGNNLEALTVENDPGVAAAAEQAPAGTFLFQAGKLPETAYASAPYLLAQAVNAAVLGVEEADSQTMMDAPTSEQMEQEIATAAAILGFDPAADLFDLLGYDFIAFSSFPSFNFESFAINAVTSVSTTDPDALAETAQKIASLIDRSEVGTEVSEQHIGEDTIYVVSGPEGEGVPAVSFGVVEDQAIIAIGDGIEELTTDPATSLAQDPRFQEVMGQLPDEYYQVGYLDLAQAIDSITMLMEVMVGTDVPSASAATPTASVGGLENVRALGAVAFQHDNGNMSGASAILYVAEP